MTISDLKDRGPLEEEEEEDHVVVAQQIGRIVLLRGVAEEFSLYVP